MILFRNGDKKSKSSFRRINKMGYFFPVCHAAVWLALEEIYIFPCSLFCWRVCAWALNLFLVLSWKADSFFD